LRTVVFVVDRGRMADGVAHLASRQCYRFTRSIMWQVATTERLGLMPLCV
jgi:hypothetical protein